jgi:WD40 repeat protein
VAARLLLLTTLTGGHINIVTSVAISPEGTRIASGSWDGTVVLWNATTGQQLR